jgi:hypothetical protein
VDAGAVVVVVTVAVLALWVVTKVIVPPGAVDVTVAVEAGNVVWYVVVWDHVNTDIFRGRGGENGKE